MVSASIRAREMIRVERISFAASGWRAIASIAALEVMPWPSAGKIVLTAIANAAAIAIIPSCVMIIETPCIIENLFFILSPKEKIPDDSVDYIILLGGGLKMNGTPSSSVSNRLDVCAELWKGLNSNCKIVACGGHIKPAPFAESIMLEKELEKRRVSKEFILQEDKSLDTIQNLQNAAILLSQQTGCSLQEILDSKISIHIFQQTLQLTIFGQKLQEKT